MIEKDPCFSSMPVPYLQGEEPTDEQCYKFVEQRRFQSPHHFYHLRSQLKRSGFNTAYSPKKKKTYVMRINQLSKQAAIVFAQYDGSALYNQS